MFGYQPVLLNKTYPRPIIFDTDWLEDVDDVMAARILIWAERAGLVDIVALIANIAMDCIPPSLDAFFIAEGRPGLVIGTDKNHTGHPGTATYHTALIAKPHTYNGIYDTEDAVTVYRRALVASNEQIDIISVGHLTAISRLLQSSADSISPLTGLQLVTQKVRKLWVMGGSYPTGAEYNFNRTASAMQAAAYVCANWPTEIIFSGNEIAGYVSGNTLATVSTTTDDVLLKAISDFKGNTNGNASYDPAHTLMACYGSVEGAGYKSYRGTVTVASDTGTSTFTPSETGKHSIVRKVKTNNWFIRELNTIYEKTSWPYRQVGDKSLSKILTDSGLVFWIDGEDFTNDPQTATWTDKSGAGNSLTASGFGYTSDSGSDGAGGVVFDGSNDYLTKTTPYALPLGDNARTLETVIKIASGCRNLFAYGTESTKKAFGLEVGASGKLTVDSYGLDWATNYTVPVGEKVHLAVTYDGFTIRLYVNGVLQDSTSSTTYTGLSTETSTLYIGKFLNYAQYFKGTLYSIKYYSKAKTGVEVLQSYQESL